MVKLKGITNEPFQSYIIPLEKHSALFRLRYYKAASIWCFDIEYNGKTVCGKKLSLGVFHLTSSNLPFDFILRDTSNMGIDPFQPDDFSSGRIAIYMFDRNEIAAIRGYDVPV